jgi:acetoin utilization protein AcuB
MKRIANVMSRRLITTSPETPVADAADLASDGGVRHLLVMDCEELVGVLCTCDLCDVDPGVRVSRCMSSPVETVGPSATLDEAATIMRRKGVGCLPVAVGGLIVGIVTRSDLRHEGLSPKAVPSTYSPDEETGGGD